MNLALFDFDGTITFGDTFTPFLRLAIAPRRIAIGRVVLAPIIIGYTLGLVPASRARERVATFGFRGRRDEDLRALGAAYARDVLPGVVRPQALARIAWHKAQGDTVCVVSASLDLYLSPWCDQLGLDLICSALEVRDGAVTGPYRGGDCTGDEKAKRILARYDLRAYPVIYAYGDTPDDYAMLRLAHKPCFRWREGCPS